MGSLETYISRVAPWLRVARPDGRPPRVLLVTAAWGAGEYDEGPVKAALATVGVGEVENLCAWHVWQAYLRDRPVIAEVAAELAAVEEATRGFYVEKSAFHAERIRRAVRFARARVPDFRLGGLPLVARDALRPESTIDSRELLGRAIARELVHDLGDLVQNDERMMGALEDAAEMLPARTGIRLDPRWRADRAALEARILDADAIVFFGGDPASLLSALRFFDLQPALHETLRRGATFFTISAGSLVLCERMIIYDDYSDDPARRDFRLFDRGLGLLGGLQLLPHCMDRIHTDDPDNLAYLARRFSSHVCAGLNEESFLLVDLAASQAISVGEHDGVYVFGPDGVKWQFHRGEHIPLG